jgi:hypothetical protein
VPNSLRTALLASKIPPAAVGGNIGPGNAPEPGAEGFTGAGGGNNGGNPPLKPQAPNSSGISAQ